MGRPVNPNVPEDGYVSKRDFENTGTICDEDFTIRDDAPQNRDLRFEVGAQTPGTKVTLATKSGQVGDITITLPSTSGNLINDGANTSLSNLISTDINQPLQTANLPSGFGTTNNLTLLTGNSTTTLGSGQNESGNILLQTGDIDDDTNVAGSITLRTGANLNSPGNNRGDITLSCNNLNLQSDSAIFLAGTTVEITSDVDMNITHKITRIADPSSAQDAATKNYVDTNIGILPSDTQTLTGGDTLKITAAFLSISSASPVSTDTSAVINTGGVAGQLLMVVNNGSNAITIKSGGNVILPGVIDYVLAASGVITFVKAYGANNTWYTQSASVN